MKHAQIQMFETTMVLLIFFIIVGFGLIFYSNYMHQQVEKNRKHVEDLNAIDVALVAMNLPEIACTVSSVMENDIVIKPGCVDMRKVEAFSDYLANNPEELGSYYFDRLQYSKIMLNEIYPEKKAFVVYSYSGLKHNEHNSSFYVPVSMYWPDKDTYSFGVMEVTLMQ